MKKCLVVDDSKVVRKVVRKIVENLGFEAHEACDGSEALSKTGEMKFDLIMLDWNMPVMDGMDFFKKFKESANFEGCKVVFCTTENEMPKIQQAVSEGANEYIMKPFDENIVKDKLQQVGLL